MSLASNLVIKMSTWKPLTSCLATVSGVLIAWLIQRHRSLGDHAEVRWLETVPAQVVTLTQMGDVDSVGLIDGEFRRDRTMEPITATVVIVALIALGC